MPLVSNCVVLTIVCLGFLSLAAGTACGAEENESLDLSGRWRFRLDPEDIGVQEEWFKQTLPDMLELPGCLQAQGYGNDVTIDTAWTGTVRPLEHAEDILRPYMTADDAKVPYWLQPDKHYVGAAWYQRDVTVPEAWTGKRITLFLERCHWVTTLWVDGTEAGSRDSLSTPHEYDVTAHITPGKHTLTLRIDNRMHIDVGENAHSISDNTQSNWNGIVGSIALRATEASRARIVDCQVYPDIHEKTAKVLLSFEHMTDGETVEVTVSAEGQAGATRDQIGPVSQSFETNKITVGGNLWVRRELEFILNLGKDALLWSEHSPALYTLFASLEMGESKDAQTVTFGLSEIATEGTRFTMNGDKIFLRGTLECCIFPRTGYPPMDVNSWLDTMRKAKACGLNHLRFHSWCPPEAAFEAADRLGMMLQIEGPFWTYTISESEALDEYIAAECDRILKAYGNHPSFCLMAYGNEPNGKQYRKVLSELVKRWKEQDPRHLYTCASGWPTDDENEFHVTPRPRVHQWGEALKSRFNSEPFASLTDYDDFVALHDVPVISHEIGQWCVYPNFDEISKYTGYLKPKNFEIFRDTLTKNGMGGLAHDFLMASGKLQAICYKEEIEAALRTKGFGGFQLLDLHDFPGQGTALVGCLDPFWDEKGYISYEEYRRFCGPTVPLVRMTKNVWTTDETFTCEVEVTHYGRDAIAGTNPQWRIENASGAVLAEGALETQDIPRGTAIPLGTLSVPLADFAAPQHVKLYVEIGEAKNGWDLWVYPPQVDVEPPESIHITRFFDDATRALLDSGAKVLLVPAPDTVAGDEAGPVQAGWSPIFWNTLWTGFQPPHTLGLLMEPGHEALKAFPTEYHSNWQWWDLVHGGQIFILNDMPGELKPIVRVIDDWVTNRRLGLIFETKVGNGSLLICGSDIVTNLEARPVARQMRHSLLAYMNSNAFSPQVSLTPEIVESLFRQPSKLSGLGATVSASSAQPGFEAAKVMDNDPGTIWHTAWEPEILKYPHWIALDLQQPVTLAGLRLLPRQDMANGRFGPCAVYVSNNPDDWGEPVQRTRLNAGTDWQTIAFDRPATGRYVRIAALAPVNNNHPWASLAELDILTDDNT
jgi:hypothetical protein